MSERMNLDLEIDEAQELHELLEKTELSVKLDAVESRLAYLLTMVDIEERTP